MGGLMSPPPPPHFGADQLTLLQLERGADYDHHNTTGSTDYRSPPQIFGQCCVSVQE